MSSYDWNEAPELIQSSLKRSAKAGEYIHRLGLEPMNGYGHIPRFSKGSLEKQFLMDARSAAKALADTHFHGRMKSLESVLSQHFVDELTAPILSHCGSLWVIPRTRREPSPCRGTLYPDRLDIDNPNHRARIKVTVCRWILVLAARELRKPDQAQRMTSMFLDTADSVEEDGGDFFDPSNDYRRAEHYVNPYNSHESTGCNSTLETSGPNNEVCFRPDVGVTGLPYLDAPLGNEPDLSPNSFQAPVAPMVAAFHTSSVTVAQSSNSRAQYHNTVINSTAPSTSPDSFIVVNAEVDRILEENEAIDGGDTDVDNAMLDPDYIPGKQSGGPKRRRKNTISGRLHKLSKTYPSRISPGGRAAECQDIYAVPTSPIGREHRDSDPIDTRSTGEEAPNNLVPSASEQNHISNAVSGPEHPRLPNSGALDTGVVFSESITTMPAIRKQFPCLIPSPIHDLRRLLKSCLKLEEDRTDEYELLVNILKTCWDAEEGTLKHRLGPSFASCQSSFQNWVGIIEKTIDLRREIGYSGENGVQFVTYLEELSEDDQWNMVGRLGEMQAWIGNLAEADATPQGLNALQNDVAVVLSELAKMPPWWKVDNFLKPILASNRKLLAWCTPRS